MDCVGGNDSLAGRDTRDNALKFDVPHNFRFWIFHLSKYIYCFLLLDPPLSFNFVITVEQ